MDLRSDEKRTWIFACAATMLVVMPGCSSWPWKSGSRDAERLTRVIHAENARLKDVVVQLRSSNEDMAQRALDDASRIARLEDENERFRSSIAAYQSERERMARSFQTLQEQVRLALGDRSDILTTSFVGQQPAGKTVAGPTPPPDGQLVANGQVLEISLPQWFAGDSAILAEGTQPRLARLGRWLSARLPREGEVRFSTGADNSGTKAGEENAGEVSDNDKAEILRNRTELEALRARRLWEALQTHLPADSEIRIRFGTDAGPAGSSGGGGSGPRLFVPLAPIS